MSCQRTRAETRARNRLRAAQLGGREGRRGHLSAVGADRDSTGAVGRRPEASRDVRMGLGRPSSGVLLWDRIASWGLRTWWRASVRCGHCRGGARVFPASTEGSLIEVLQQQMCGAFPCAQMCGRGSEIVQSLEKRLPFAPLPPNANAQPGRSAARGIYQHHTTERLSFHLSRALQKVNWSMHLYSLSCARRITLEPRNVCRRTTLRPCQNMAHHYQTIPQRVAAQKPRITSASLRPAGPC